jgi:hypothetical protein
VRETDAVPAGMDRPCTKQRLGLMSTTMSDDVEVSLDVVHLRQQRRRDVLKFDGVSSNLPK